VHYRAGDRPAYRSLPVDRKVALMPMDKTRMAEQMLKTIEAREAYLNEAAAFCAFHPDIAKIVADGRAHMRQTYDMEKHERKMNPKRRT